MAMKFWVQIGDRSFETEVSEDGDRTLVLVEGQEMELQLSEGAPGTYTLLANGQPYDLAAVRQLDGYSMVVSGAPLDVTVVDERTRRLAATATSTAAAEDTISLPAPMPGLVAQVEVAEGDAVEAGQRLVVLEAMKMENDIVAPRAGRVDQIRVSQGQTVEQGAILVVIE